MSQLHTHYRLLLGLDDSWDVVDVQLSIKEKRVEIELAHRNNNPVVCSECGAACSIADHAAERTWQHLDTMQFETRLRARLPRAKCAQCGIKTCTAPWAEPHSRFTLLFESFVIELLQACGTVSAVAKLMNLNWKSIHAIMARAVERGLLTRDLQEVEQVGIDEKSFGHGHNYVSVLTDIGEHRVVEVVEGRDEEAANKLWKSLGLAAQNVKAVALDMWPAYAKATETHAPQAEIVHDHFHVSKHLNGAVDQVRREEHAHLQKHGDETLTGSKQLWLFNPENLSDEQAIQFAPLKKAALKTAKAWAIKDLFREFWEYRYAANAKKFFSRWYRWADRCQLKPIKRVAEMIKNHLPRLLSYFRNRITNAMSEGFNSKIQQLKSAARGFRNFANYRIRILFFCGKLQLQPPNLTH
jgi:transposase